MTGKILVTFLVLSALLTGGAMYWLQEYGFQREIAPEEYVVELTPNGSDTPEPILADDIQIYDAVSSPQRYRACFTTTMSEAMLTETYRVYDDPVPLVAPNWFDCFDATEVGEALEAESAFAFLGQANIVYGVDRVVAILEDGRGFVWHQINRCGKEVYDGKPPPEGCPPPPAQTD